MEYPQRSSGETDDAGVDWVVLSPVPVKVAWFMTWNPDHGRWVLRQQVMVWSRDFERFQTEEIIEFTFQSHDDLLSVLRQNVDGSLGYVTVTGDGSPFGQ